MSISPVASTIITPNAPAPARIPEQVEGNTPDGDGDADDMVQTITSPSNNSTVGSNLNVTA